MVRLHTITILDERITAMFTHSRIFPVAFRLRRSAAALAHLPARLHAAFAMARSRRQLATLEDHILKDIGLTRAEAHAEAKRQAWDAPLHWKG
jgi:uncharacterized protein YjiS (DUF1127 family)